MPTQVVLVVGRAKNMTQGVKNALGLNHCGLICDRGAMPLYITWDGTVAGLAPSQTASQKTPLGMFGKMPASRRVGFSDIRNIHTRQIEDNPNSWMGVNPLDAETDFGGYDTRRFSIPVRAPAGITTQSSDLLFGIDANAISVWWMDMLNLDPDSPQRQYRKFARMGSDATNCCGMIGRALQIGKLDAYADPPKNLFYQGSSTLIRWVNSAVERINFLNESRQKIMITRGYRDASGFPWGDQQDDFNGSAEMPSLKEWLHHSAVQETLKTGLARRKEQIAEIDRLLPQYHLARERYRQLKKIEDTALSANLDDANVAWQKILVSIYEQCFKHLAYKPNSDRRGAVLSLTKTIQGIFSGNATYMEKVANGYFDQPSNESHATVIGYKR